MSRPQKQTVDFFPHYCNHGKTIFILEQKYQLRGYCLWFKLLEELGSHNGHYLDFNDESYVLFFSAKTMVSVTEIQEIMGLLSGLNAIDKKLWENKIVWSQNFVDNLSQVYDKRVVSAPQKPVSDTEIGVSVNGNPQSKVKESKVNILASNDATYFQGTKPISMEELTYEYDTPSRNGKKKKLYARIAIYYMGLLGKTGNVLRYYPAIKEIVGLAEKEFKTDEDIEAEVKARIDIADWHYRNIDCKEWGLGKVAENWDIILKDWHKEKTKHQV